MKVQEYGLKILSITMNALTVAGAIGSGNLLEGAAGVTLLVADIKDLGKMIREDLKPKE